MDQKKVITELSKALRKDPQNKLLYSKRADLYLEQQEYDKAIDDYSSAIILDPEDAASYYDRGMAYDLMHEYKNAIKDFSAAIKLNADDWGAFYSRARCYERLAELKKAIKDYTSAIKLNPNDARGYYGRAVVHQQLGMAEKAKEDFEKAEQLSKTDSATHPLQEAVYIPAAGSGAEIIKHDVPIMVFPTSPEFEELNWGIGDRVFARWKDLYWYPATILNTQRTAGGGTEHLNSVYDHYHVLYDDGWQVMIPSIALLPLSLEGQGKVFVRPKHEHSQEYSPAKLLQLEGEAIQVEYQDGLIEQNRISRVRIWRCPVKTEMPFVENERVFCLDLDGYFYPADIISIKDDEVLIHLLFGGERQVTQEFIYKFVVNVGDRVECRWKGAPVYFPCTIEERLGERILVLYDDGVKEWSTIRLLRTLAKRADV